MYLDYEKKSIKERFLPWKIKKAKSRSIKFSLRKNRIKSRLKIPEWKRKKYRDAHVQRSTRIYYKLFIQYILYLTRAVV